MEEETALQEISTATPLRRYYGEERRRLFPREFTGVERRIPDPPCEQDFDDELAPN